MSAEDQKRLFQRFYLIQNEKTHTISGTGLGLWIIKKYIEAMGGRIEVTSLQDIGSEFTVHLPILPLSKISTSFLSRAFYCTRSSL